MWAFVRFTEIKDFIICVIHIAFDFLISKSIIFEHQKQIGKYFVDFCIDKTIIEIDGAHWHNKEKDAIRDNELSLLGYTVYRIDSKERIHHRIEQIISV